MNKDKDYFINAYHFIPLPKQKATANSKGEPLFTGRLEYRLTTKTPLFIPNTSNDHTFTPKEGWTEEHISYDFFSYHSLSKGQYYDDVYFEPIVQGSEVRGMLRSVYETITDSCLSAIQGEKEFLSKRTMEYGLPGLIRFEKGQLCLYEATSYAYYEGEKGTYKPFYKNCEMEEGCPVHFQVQKSKSGRLRAIQVERADGMQAQKSQRIGYLIKGEKGIELDSTDEKKKPKYNCHVFFTKPGTKPSYRVSEKAQERFLNVIKSYQQQEPTAYQEYQTQLNDFLSQQNQTRYFPVYYSILDSGALYLSPACVSREAYQNTMYDLIGDLKPCNGEGVVCPACDLFGVLGKKNEFSISSKLRFTDAQPEKGMADAKEYYCPITTIPVLGQPKLSNTEFYLKQRPNAVMTTFDYYVHQNGKIIEKAPEIAGRKFYWHQNIKEVPTAPKLSEADSQKKQLEMNRTIRAVKPNVAFHGYVYFEQVTEMQLNQLIWMLNFSTLNPQHGYKMGMGKPLGLGSVSMELVKEGCCLHRWKLCNGQITCKDERTPWNQTLSYEDVKFSESVKQPFLFMTDFDATKGWTVSYPYCNVDEEDKGYEWYTKNHVGKDKYGNLKDTARGRNNMVTLQHLTGFEEIKEHPYSMNDFKLPTNPKHNLKSPTNSNNVEQKKDTVKNPESPKNIVKNSKSKKVDSTEKNKCVWIAKSKLSPPQEKLLKSQLRNISLSKQEYHTFNAIECPKLASEYAGIALPSNTPPDLVELAQENFSYVMVAKKKGKFEEGWEKKDGIKR